MQREEVGSALAGTNENITVPLDKPSWPCGVSAGEGLERSMLKAKIQPALETRDVTVKGAEERVVTVKGVAESMLMSAEFSETSFRAGQPVEMRGLERDGASAPTQDLQRKEVGSAFAGTNENITVQLDKPSWPLRVSAGEGLERSMLKAKIQPALEPQHVTLKGAEESVVTVKGVGERVLISADFFRNIFHSKAASWNARDGKKRGVSSRTGCAA